MQGSPLGQQPPRAFGEALASGRFLVTTEEPRPKGTNLAGFFERAERLRGVVDAVNLTESSGAVLTMSPIGAVPGLLILGLHPILQLTCRDRNRIALQADLLAAAPVGVETVSCMAEDPISRGDIPHAVSVFDLDTPSLVKAALGLAGGTDLASNALKDSPSFFRGAVVNPSAPDLQREVDRIQAKVDAGAQFFQTQAVYDSKVFERFIAHPNLPNVPVLAGFIVLNSGKMARRLNESLPDVCVPERLIRKLDHAEDVPAESVQISGQILSQLRPTCRGLHVIAVGWKARLPAILDLAGIEGRP